ncbi:MAG: FecR domain-containing protein [Bacteriovoracaceae bacterium]
MNKITGSTILITLSVVGLISSGALLYFDVFSTLKKRSKQGEAVAKLTSSQNLVQKKRSLDIGWEKAGIGDEFYLKDQVYTYDDAAAELAFDKKSVVKLGSNSLLKIEKQNNNTVLDFLHGEFLVKTSSDSKTKIQSAGENIDLKSGPGKTELLLNQSGDKKNITVLKGNAVLQVGDQKVEVNSGHHLSVDLVKQEFDVEELAINLISPEPNQVVLFNPKVKNEISLKWNSDKDISAYEIILAKDQNFEKILTKKIVESNSFDVGNIINAGKFYWKVVATNHDKTESYKSAIYSFHVKLDLPPTLIQPFTRQEIIIEDGQPETYFEWSNLSVEKYEFVLSEAGSDLVLKSMELSDNRILLKDLAPGSYVWKVKAIDRNRPTSSFSELSYFTIVNKKEAKPYDLIYNLKLQPTMEIQPEQSVNFAWKYYKKSKNISFLVEVAIDVDFNKVIFNSTTPNSFISWNSPSYGELFWRVTPVINEQPDTSRTSNIANFSHLLKAIEIERIENIAKKGQIDTIKIYWNKLAQAKVSYIVEIAQDQEFSKLIVNEELKNNSFEYKGSEAGIFFVRVKYKLDDAISMFSPVKSFELVKPVLPPGPTAPELKPELDLEILESRNSPVNLGEDIHLIFSAPERAVSRYTIINLPKIDSDKKYYIEIYDDSKLKKLIYKGELEVGQDSYRWVDSPEGTYYMRTAVIDEYGRQSDFSNVSKVRVNDSIGKAKKKAEREEEERLRRERLAEIEKERMESFKRDQTEIKVQDEIKKDEALEEELRKSVWLAVDYNSLQVDLGFETVSLTSSGNTAGLMNQVS